MDQSSHIDSVKDISSLAAILCMQLAVSWGVQIDARIRNRKMASEEAEAVEKVEAVVVQLGILKSAWPPHEYPWTEPEIRRQSCSPCPMLNSLANHGM